MTSVPKPLKFLRPHFGVLEAHYKKIPNSEHKQHLADVLSVLATTVATADLPRPSLHYRLEGTSSNLTSWGNEYLRNLSGEISVEFAERQKREQATTDLLPLVEEIVPFNMKHHAEWDALDLLCEVDRIEDIKSHIYDLEACDRVVLYLVNAASYAATVDEVNKILTVATDILLDKKQYAPALRTAFRLQDSSVIQRVIEATATSYREAVAVVRAMAKQGHSIPTNMERVRPGSAVSTGSAGSTGATAKDTEMKDGVDEDETLRLATVSAQEYWLTLKQMTLLARRQRVEFDWGSLKVTDAEEPDESYTDGTTDDFVLVSTGNAVKKRPVKKSDEKDDEEMREVDGNSSSTAAVGEGGATGDAVEPPTEDTETESRADHLARMARGERLSEFYGLLGKELDVLDPKTPEDVYKTSLEDRRSVTSIESAKTNLAATLVNAFVNLGFRTDKLMLVQGDGFLFKNKDHGMMSASASLGALLLWHMDDALTRIDKYQYSEDTNVRGGALMAFGIVHSGMSSEYDPVHALLSEHLTASDAQVRIGTVLGLGLAYAGTCKKELLDVFVPIIVESSIRVSAMCALALGLVFTGSCHDCAADVILQTMDDRQNDGTLDGAVPRFYAVALGLVFLSRRDACEAVLAALTAIEHPLSKYAAVTVEGCAYAGTGDVIKIQKMLQKCVEQPKPESTESNDKESSDTPAGTGTAKAKDDSEVEDGKAGETASAAAPRSSSANVLGEGTPAKASAASSSSSSSADEEREREGDKIDQAAAVMAIPLIALGEEVGSDMCVRMMDHLLQYADLPLRRAVPLALALYSCSNPRPALVDTLSKLSHDFDMDVALHAIIALGIVGAGTNNSRIAQLLRQLASFYQKDSNGTFTIRVAQGLLYMGKGLVTISPLHSDRFLMPPVALGSLVVVLHACLNMTDTILGQLHYLLFFLVPSVYPRMLFTVDEDMKPIAVSVRVGQAVDTVAQAGNPRRITGFQTHNTPVLLSYSDRAELATDEYLPLTPVLEGIVFLRKNPDYKPPKTLGK